MSKHTPEPWVVGGYFNPGPTDDATDQWSPWIIGSGPRSVRVGRETVMYAPDKSRAVACVNALAGIDDPAAFVKAAREAAALLDEAMLYIVEVEECHKPSCRTLSKRVMANLAALRAADAPSK